MITLLLPFVLAASPFPSLDDWMAARGYSSMSAYGDDLAVQDISYRPIVLVPNPPRGDSVYTVFQAYVSPKAATFSTAKGDLAFEQEGQFSAPGDANYQHTLPSGRPLGTDAWALRANDGTVKLRFRTRWMRGDVLVIPWKGVPKDPDALAEGAARLLVGLVESRRLENSSSRAVPGGMLKAWQNADALSFGDLDAWMGLHGWTAKLDDDRQVETLTKGTHTLVVPLGAAAVQVDGTWKDLPDVTMLKEGKWWTPLDALEAVTAKL